jgi:hypothetical protein
MANLKFDKELTALLAIDPYNDFISEGRGRPTLSRRFGRSAAKRLSP